MQLLRAILGVKYWFSHGKALECYDSVKWFLLQTDGDYITWESACTK